MVPPANRPAHPRPPTHQQPPSKPPTRKSPIEAAAPPSPRYMHASREGQRWATSCTFWGPCCMHAALVHIGLAAPFATHAGHTQRRAGAFPCACTNKQAADLLTTTCLPIEKSAMEGSFSNARTPQRRYSCPEVRGRHGSPGKLPACLPGAIVWPRYACMRKLLYVCWCGCLGMHETCVAERQRGRVIRAMARAAGGRAHAPVRASHSHPQRVLQRRCHPQPSRPAPAACHALTSAGGAARHAGGGRLAAWPSCCCHRHGCRLRSPLAAVTHGPLKNTPGRSRARAACRAAAWAAARR